jgi:tetratricopeptide (TPR) repeat protein
VSARAELGALEASGLIQIAALQPELEYLFRHALVQDAAYSSLLKQDRRALHGLAAETLLAVYPDRRRELAAVIAMHFELAGDEVRAAEQLVIAGEHAAERFANHEALAFFDRALAMLPRDDAHADPRLRSAIGAAKAGMAVTGPNPAIDRLEQGIAAAGERSDRRLLADAYFWVAFLRQRRGEKPESSPELREALDRGAEIGEALGDASARAIPKAFLAVDRMTRGELRAGAQQLSAALDELEGKVDPRTIGMLSDFVAFTYAHLGDFRGADAAVARSERLAQIGDDIARLDANLARTMIYLERGDAAESSSLAAQCAAQSEHLGAVMCAVGANIMLGSARFALADAIGAKAPLERSRELSQFTPLHPLRTLAVGLLGSVRASLGDLPTGTADLNEALAAGRMMQDRFGEATILQLRAATYAHQTPPDWTAALADLDAAVAHFEAMDARPSIARALRARAQALRAVGRAGDADEAERRSREIASQIGLKDFN